jgi:hypothetical protein
MSGEKSKDSMRGKVIEWLGSLTDKDFAEVFYEATASRTTSDSPGCGGHFVLADTEKVNDGEWETDLIALHDPEAYPEGMVSDAPICQSGICSACKSGVRCWAKGAICPVCGEKVGCS